MPLTWNVTVSHVTKHAKGSGTRLAVLVVQVAFWQTGAADNRGQQGGILQPCTEKTEQSHIATMWCSKRPFSFGLQSLMKMACGQSKAVSAGSAKTRTVTTIFQQPRTLYLQTQAQVQAHDTPRTNCSSVGVSAASTDRSIAVLQRAQLRSASLDKLLAQCLSRQAHHDLLSKEHTVTYR